MSPQRGEGDWDFRRLMLLARGLGLAPGVGAFRLLVGLVCDYPWGEAPLSAAIRAFPFQEVIRACPGLLRSANEGRWAVSIVYNSRALNDQPLPEALRIACPKSPNISGCAARA